MPLTGALFAAALLAGCDSLDEDTKDAGSAPVDDGLGVALGEPGQALLKSDGTTMFVDPSSRGQAGSIRVVEVFWGRLVDVYDFDEATAIESLVHRNYVIGQAIQTDGVDYRLQDDPITGRTSLTILHPRGTENYREAFTAVHDSLEPIEPQGIGGVGPFSQVARNAAVVLRFDDLLNPDTINSDTIRMFVGNPPETPFGSRVFPDPNFGQLFDESIRTFRPTRVIVDVTVSEAEVVSEFPPPPINNVGLPPSPSQLQGNVAIRLPSKQDFAAGVFAVVQNLVGNALTTVGNSAVDTESLSVDLVHAFRSGSPEDENNGFLLDTTLPRIIGQQDIFVSDVRCATGGATCEVDPGGLYLVTLTFQHDLCYPTLVEEGDLLELTNGNFVELVESADAPDEDTGVVEDVLVRDLTAANPSTRLIRDVEGTFGLFLAEFEPVDGDEVQCFISFSPPAKTFPNGGVDPRSVVKIRFSEPMEPASTSALEDLMITRTDEELGPEDIVVANAVPTPDLKNVSIEPILPLNHKANGTEEYFVRIGEREAGLTDLAGNRVVDIFDIAPSFTLDPEAPENLNGGYVLRFNTETLDEDPEKTPVDKCAGPEVAGQFLHDPDRGLIKGRPVSRYSMIVDADNPVIGLMSGLPLNMPTGPSVYDTGTNEPLVGTFGSRTMTVWRYCDMGLSSGGLPPDGGLVDVADTLYFNLDVEGISWSATGSVIADVFDQFEIALAHSARFPDEGYFPTPGGKVSQDPATLGLPLAWLFGSPYLYSGNSGLDELSSFADAALDDGTDDPLKVVHSRELGYLVDPSESFTSSSENLMMPYPLNEGPDPSQYRYYTWRDTAIQASGGVPSLGVEFVRSLFPYGQGIPPQVLSDNLGLFPMADFRGADGSFTDANDISDTTPAEVPILIEMPPFSATFAWQGAIPSIAMPLLMDFRCFPDTGGGFNRPDVRYAGFPLIWGDRQTANFRLTSTGGVNASGVTRKIVPDIALDPLGGFNTNPLSDQVVGAPTDGGDAMFHLGQLDLVARVSRTYTRWFSSEGSTQVVFKDPVIFPSNDDQPTGTRIDVHFRGATKVDDVAQNKCKPDKGKYPGPGQSAINLDSYGDEKEQEQFPVADPRVPTWYVPYGLPENRNDHIQFLNDTAWKSQVEEIETARFFQARITFVSNPRSGIAPTLGAIGFAYDLD